MKSFECRHCKSLVRKEFVVQIRLDNGGESWGFLIKRIEPRRYNEAHSLGGGSGFSNFWLAEIMARELLIDELNIDPDNCIWPD